MDMRAALSAVAYLNIVMVARSNRKRLRLFSKVLWVMDFEHAADYLKAWPSTRAKKNG